MAEPLIKASTMLGFSMKKPSILIIFAFTVLISPLATGIRHPFHAFQRNCSYSIQIETTCASAAGTTDAIGVRFGDSDGNLVIIKRLKNPKLVYDPKLGVRKQREYINGFERCAIEMFEASGTCMNRSVCSLYLKQFGSDGWRPGWVKVLHRQDDGRVSQVSYVFYFRTFVPENVWFGFDYCDSSNRQALPHEVADIRGET